MAFKWYPWNVLDFRKDTYHLSAAADGIYRRLIDEYMVTRGSLPDDDASLAGIARVDNFEWEAHRDTIRKFFKAQNGRLFHKRCEIEIHAQAMRTACRVAAGKVGARARWEKFRSGNGLNANGMRDLCDTYANGVRIDATLHKKDISKRETEGELSTSPALAKTLKEKGWI